MKQFSPIQKQLLKCLADGQYHDTHSLSKQADLSSEEVRKEMQQLIELGLQLQSFPQQAYKLSIPFKALDETSILSQPCLFGQNIKLHLFSEIDSTNSFLKDLSTETSAINVCCAEKQTKGRGRFGRQWNSPFGENIYLSILWKPDCSLSRLSGLSLVVSMAILDSLKNNGILQDILVKWPNDLLWENKKLCGVLIEAVQEADRAQIIIGIGINVNTTGSNQSLSDKPWCSLYEITGQYLDRNKLIAELLASLNCYLMEFLQKDFGAFLERWQQIDYLEGREITVHHPSGSISGKACGVNSPGQLCLRDSFGKLHFLSSGDTTLS